jgi:hypothetical protein
MRAMFQVRGVESRARLVTSGAPCLLFLQGWDSTDTAYKAFSAAT